MASMNFSSSKQWVKPPQRGIFPLDHDKECKEYMEIYLSCLKREQQQHNKCRELSKDYLQCRMDRQLMAKEDLNDMGFGDDTIVKNASEYDKSKEKSGYIAGKHIDKPMKWWFQR
jgi:cytochrome c oxidase assembly protein subunit 19